MHDDGIPLPWFHSRSERMARAACEAELPECRDSVRQELATEKAISRTVPWVLLCIAVWVAIRIVRAREQKRERAKQEAARHHVRTSARERQRPAANADGEAAEDEVADDGFGMGPGDRPSRQ
jgi:hypothetical protein